MNINTCLNDPTKRYWAINHDLGRKRIPIHIQAHPGNRIDRNVKRFKLYGELLLNGSVSLQYRGVEKLRSPAVTGDFRRHEWATYPATVPITTIIHNG
jgi:hypothetical protein